MRAATNTFALIFLALGCLGLRSNAQPQAKPLHFDQISIEQGLSENTVRAILQDQQGFMWFATEDGLDRYDGYEFQVFKHDPENPGSLSNNLVVTLYADRSGQLWVGTYDGLDRLDPRTGTFTHYREDPQDPRSLSGKTVQAILGDQGGALWVGTGEGGLNRLDPGTSQFVHYRHVSGDPTTLSSDSVFAIMQDREGTMWIGTSAGLDRWDPSSGAFIHYHEEAGLQPSLSQSQVNGILEDRDGSLWVATLPGLYQLDRNRSHLVRYRNDPNDPGSLASDSVRTVFEDQAGVLWLGTREGLDQLDPSLGTFIHHRHSPIDPNSLSSDSIDSIYQDRSGVMWIGTSGGGLSKCNPTGQKFESYQLQPGLPHTLSDNNVWAIDQDAHGDLWIGTFYAGLNRVDPQSGTVTVLSHNDGDPASLSSNEVRALWIDHEGTLWVGTEHGGLNRFDPETGGFVHYRHNPADPTSLSDDSVFAILEDSRDRLWIGTSGGLDLLDPGTGGFIHYQHDPAKPQSLSDDGVRAILEDANGVLWVGTAGGLDAWNGGGKGFSHYRNAPQDETSLSNDFVISLAKASDGGLWVGTFGGGLNHLNRPAQTFTRYSTKDGLPDDTVCGILVDRQGALWLSTNGGLSRFDPHAGTFRNYDVSDGLQGDQYNIGAYYESTDGEMFFGGLNGFDRFFPEQVKDNPIPPPIAITAIKVSNQTVGTYPAANEEIHLSYRDYAISFEFAALDYNASAKNQYAYRLDGVDRDWVYAGTRRYASYTNLNGGAYTFRVKASNGDGVWSNNPLTIRILVAPPFWGTWWFRAIAVLLLAGAAFGAYRYRVHSIEAQRRQLEIQVRRRTQELAVLNSIASLVSRSLDLKEIMRDALNKMLEVTDMESGSACLMETEPMEAASTAASDLRKPGEAGGDILATPWDSTPVADTYRSRLRSMVNRGSPEDLLTSAPHLARAEEALASAARNARPEVWQVEHLQTKEGPDPERTAQVITVPLMAKGRLVGAVDLATYQARTFPPEQLSLLAAVGQQIGMAVENARLYEQAELSAALAERTRLARELHDSVTQSLYSMTLYAEAGARSLTSGKPLEAADLLRQLRDTAVEALREMRLLIFQLRPPVLEKTGLANALRARLDSVETRSGIQTELVVEGGPDPGQPSLALQQELYGIAQEALNNVLKHAHAQHVRVLISFSNELTRLEITDDGVGFTPEIRQGSGGLGLAGIMERAQKLGGTVDIKSEPGKGTSLLVRAPARSTDISGQPPLHDAGTN